MRFIWILFYSLLSVTHYHLFSLKIVKMEVCQEESMEHAPDEQHQQQQQTTVEKERRSPFLSPTTPAWGDRNVVSNRTTPLRLNFISLFLFLRKTRTLFILWTLLPLRSIKCRRGNTRWKSYRYWVFEAQAWNIFSYLHLLCRLFFYFAEYMSLYKQIHISYTPENKF